MARRMLWLKPWTADGSSKTNYCRIPFDGKALFGRKLEAAILKVTGGKSGLIPQDLETRRQQQPERRQFTNKPRDRRSFGANRKRQKRLDKPTNVSDTSEQS